MEKELDRLINIYGLSTLRSYLSEKRNEEKKVDYRNDWNINWRRYAKLGLRKEDLGIVFRYGKDSYAVTGLKTANPKYPLLADRVKDGKGFKFEIIALTASRKVEELKKTLLEEMNEKVEIDLDLDKVNFDEMETM